LAGEVLRLGDLRLLVFFGLLRFPEPLFFTQRFVPLYVVSTVHVFPSFPVLLVPTA